MAGIPIKIYIVGSVASGKTTLAKKLSAQYGIPCYEGDCIAWGFPGETRYKRSDAEQKEIIDGINQNNSWIIEGTLRNSQRCILDLADRVIFLDTPLWVRRMRIVTRFLKQKLRLEASHYQPTVRMYRLMFHWTEEFERNRTAFEDDMRSCGSRLIWIKSEKELRLQQ